MRKAARTGRAMRITGGHRRERQGAVMGQADIGIWWRKSSYSGGDNNCVEAGTTHAGVAVRDTKNPHGGTLRISADAWRTFTESICPR
jgi:hypothetical protein